MTGLGSGFIISEDGIVVTNNHVIEGADEITVILNDETEFTAELLGRDPKADIAVLKIDPKNKKLTYVGWGDSDKMRVGDWSIAIGNPLGLGGTVTAGIISAISRDLGSGPYVKFLQTDASINRGNSGGPLFNLDGEVIGINTAIVSQTGGSIGLGFAIPANSAKKIVQQLKDFGKTKRGWLGVQIQPVTKDFAESLGLPDQKGAFISNVNPNGPSKTAGLEPGDVILKFNNIEIKHLDSSDDTVEIIKVPLAYGPKQKFLARLDATPDPTNKRVQITLPRISFEINGIQYDPVRKVSPTQKIKVAKDVDENKNVYMPVPYNLSFELAIISKTQEHF